MELIGQAVAVIGVVVIVGFIVSFVLAMCVYPSSWWWKR